MDTSSEQLAIAIGKALGGGQASAYTGTSYCQSGNHLVRHTISVHPRAFIWSATELPDGPTRTFEPRSLTLQTDGVDDFSLSIDRIPFSFPEAVQLSFPLSLPIWGRQLDDYHPVACEVNGSDTTLLLRHRADRTIFGSFTFDTESGIAKTLFTPTTALKLERELPPENGEHDFGFVAGQGDPDLQNRLRPDDNTH
ncbi:hypothetical protein QEH68_05960 [Paenarthrobacter sp. OM7]|uniref:hypothetical protein n=1 Tax=Paenarthrobacter sp. OM7 TaxID=3041264 RepID=UPI002469C28B|nr:hypothetical protein [Paenarthrobacter sp. OM7]WGM21716.1 hypothetical protein QEH68_05960 [Paenarthrobacter sp. OM7]